ncbi:MAG: SLBB domain-containing protein [Armatimonadetes bacterium]|nr:SLBB domain-containing protein [Armatimonadota bacterium]
MLLLALGGARAATVIVVGEVAQPGAYEFQEGDTLSRAVTLAGGPTREADLGRAVLHREGRVLPIGLEAILKRGAADRNLELRAGDALVVPSVRREATVTGEVVRPGAYRFRDGDSVSDAIRATGGISARADPRRVVLRRGGVEIPLDLHAVLAHGEAEGDLKLRDGDAVVVRALPVAYVVGAVRKPGAVPVGSDDSRTLLSLLAAAGGALPTADLSRSLILRGSAAPFQVIPVNLKEALARKQETPLMEGDVLYVSHKGGRRGSHPLDRFPLTGDFEHLLPPGKSPLYRPSP